MFKFKNMIVFRLFLYTVSLLGVFTHKVSLLRMLIHTVSLFRVLTGACSSFFSLYSRSLPYTLLAAMVIYSA